MINIEGSNRGIWVSPEGMGRVWVESRTHVVLIKHSERKNHISRKSHTRRSSVGRLSSDLTSRIIINHETVTWFIYLVSSTHFYYDKPAQI